MSSADIAALITALGVAVGALIGSIAALINAQSNKHEQDELKEKVEEEHQQRIKLEDQQEETRQTVIRMGESMHDLRLDNAVIAEGFNQLFSEFREVTGHKPAVNLERLKHMRTIAYITGPLENGPLQLKE